MVQMTKFFALVILLSGLAHAAYGAPNHGISLYGALKYASDFSHFDYVNPKAPKGGILRLQAQGSFDSLNPFVIKGTSAAGLVPLHPSHTFATLLASSHDEPFSRYGYIAETVDLASDHLSVSFKIRPQATFHDGSPITPEDVIFTFETLTKKGHPLYRAYYADVASVSSPSPGIVRFVFKVADNKELPLILGEMPILSKKFFNKNTFEDASLTPLLGSGPYRISIVKPGHSIEYQRVKNWWGDTLAVNKGLYNFDYIRYDYYRDNAVSFEAFKSNEYDIRFENTASLWATGYTNLVKKGKVTQLELSTENPDPMQGLIFNTRRPLFKDRNVRRALTYAFDFEWLNENLFHGLYARLTSYFQDSELASFGLPEGEELELLKRFEDQLPPFVFTTPYTLPQSDGSGQIRHHLRAAKKLLKAAGYTIEKGKLINPHTQKPFSFEILIAQPSLEKILLRFVDNLRLLGVDVKLRLVDSAQYLSRLDSYDYDMIVGTLAQSLSPGNEQREFWASTRASVPGSRNFAGIADPVIDALIEILNDAPTRQSLVHATRALDRVLLWGYYLIPMYYSPKTLLAYGPNVVPPSQFPKYHIGFETWWSKKAPLKEN